MVDEEKAKEKTKGKATIPKEKKKAKMWKVSRKYPQDRVVKAERT